MGASLADYDFDLPTRLIAQEPSPVRDQSRLLVLDRRSGETAHQVFYDLADCLQSGDVLVLNDTRVVPAKVTGRKGSGGRVECLVLNYPESPVEKCYSSPCLLKSSRKPGVGDRITFGEWGSGEILPPTPNGTARVLFRFPGSFAAFLCQAGQTPLPPYIRRKEDAAARQEQDAERYQTVYAERPGAVAAPTAGLHFTPELLARIRAKGVLIAPVTLHVGYGTFAPIKTDDLAEHRMHAESFHLSRETARIIEDQKRKGKRVFAAGTTSLRALEYVAFKRGKLVADQGECDLFITPGHKFRIVDALITNFHLPRTTLILLVAAFAGRENILQAYREAIDRDYRFYSYGDAMVIV
jgi:S-adenosylmethionine:tRNA ribosyltransferase-isomerase